MQITPPARPRRHDGFNRWRDATTDRRGTAMTAARFCRLRGFETVAGYSTQPASATRTIGDFAAADGARTAFYAIRCERAADAASFARG
jgi:hypothetical protein